MDTLKMEGSTENNVEQNDSENMIIKVYKRRWYILLLYMCYSTINCFQMLQYASITEIVSKYYEVSTVAVNWTAIIPMVPVPFLVIPACILIQRTGLRLAALIGCGSTTLAAALKIFAVQRNLFWLVIMAQFIAGCAQTTIISITTKIPSIWFKPSEVSTACSLGVFSFVFGIGIGSSIPPMLVNEKDSDSISRSLHLISWTVTGAAIPVMIAVIVYFPNHPPLPPSRAQAACEATAPKVSFTHTLNSLKQLFRTEGFILQLLIYAINVASFNSFATLLSEFVTEYFKDDYSLVGIVGLCINFVGIVGIVIFGILMDKTHKYKQINLCVYTMCCICVGAFIWGATIRSKVCLCLCASFLGLFFHAYQATGLEMAMELTFPMNECLITSIIFGGCQICGVILGPLLALIHHNMGSLWALLTMAAMNAVGTAIQVIVPNRLNRQKALCDDNKKQGQ